MTCNTARLNPGGANMPRTVMATVVAAALCGAASPASEARFGDRAYPTAAEAMAHLLPKPRWCPPRGRPPCLATLLAESVDGRLMWRPGPWIEAGSTKQYCTDAATANTVLACDAPGAVRVYWDPAPVRLRPAAPAPAPAVEPGGANVPKAGACLRPGEDFRRRRLWTSPAWAAKVGG